MDQATAQTRTFPDTIICTPENAPILRELFGKEADVDLLAYQAVAPADNLGQRVWDMYQSEVEHKKAMALAQARLDNIGTFGWYKDLIKSGAEKLRSLSPFGP